MKNKIGMFSKMLPVSLIAMALLIVCTNAVPASTPESSQESLDEILLISVDEAKAKLDQGRQITFIDVWRKDSFDELHIAGAISIPLSEIKDNLSKLPSGAYIITY